jgi:hypothetical protein
MASKLGTITMFVITAKQTTFHEEFINIFVTYVHNKISHVEIQWFISYHQQNERQILISCGSHVVLYSTIITSMKVTYFSKIYHNMKLQDPTLSSASVAPIQEICMPVMLVLLMTGN